MPAIIDEVGLTTNLEAYWNLDASLPLYPDNVSTFYRRYGTTGEWNGSEISAVNSTLTRDAADPSADGELIITAPTSGGNSGVLFTFSSAIPVGTTNFTFSAYGFASKVFVIANTPAGTITKQIGMFPATIVTNTPVYSWNTFNFCLGNYSITSLQIYIAATNYVGSISTVAIASGGSLYTSDDIGATVTLGGSGTGGKAVITSVSGGLVNGVSMTSAGTGYTNAATVTTSGITTGSGLTLTTTVRTPFQDYFKIDYLNIMGDTQYFNNTWATNDGWTNGVATSGKLTQTSAVLSKTFSNRADGMRFRAYVALTAGTNPIITINSINSVITTDGNYNLVEVILPANTTTITITSTGNTLSYSFIYIGLGNYSTYQVDSYTTSLNLYPVGINPVSGIFGPAYSFNKAFAYTNVTPYISAAVTTGFLMYAATIPSNGNTATMFAALPPYSATTPTGVNYSIGLSTIGANAYITFTFIDASYVSRTLTGKIIISPNAWHYIAVTHTGGAATIYVDGTPDPAFASTLFMPTTNLSTVLLGALDTGNTNYFTGKLQEIRLYSYAASDSEILAQYTYYKTFITTTALNYGASTESNIFSSYTCLDTLPDPPDGNRTLYIDSYSYPYSLSNVTLLNTTRKIVNTSYVTYFSQDNAVTGFSLPVSIVAGNNYFRINMSAQTTNSTTVYADITHGAGVVATTTLTTSLSSTAGTFEYISSFGDTITSIKIYMNNARQGDGFIVNWMYYGDGTDTTKLIDATGNGNTASLVEVFSVPTGVKLTGSSSITTPTTSLASGFGISMWFNPTTITANQTLFLKSLPSGYSVNPLAITTTTTGDISVAYATSTSTTSSLVTTISPLTIANHHLAITYLNYTYYTYLDGNLITSKADLFSDAASASIFGSSYTGILDNMRIYARSLSAGEVNFLFINQR